jgi:hypothetical protein
MLFPNNVEVSKADCLPIHTARIVQSWFEQHEDALRLLWPAQSLDSNIIEPLWSVLESRVKSRLPLNIISQATRRCFP